MVVETIVEYLARTHYQYLGTEPSNLVVHTKLKAVMTRDGKVFKYGELIKSDKQKGEIVNIAAPVLGKKQKETYFGELVDVDGKLKYLTPDKLNKAQLI